MPPLVGEMKHYSKYVRISTVLFLCFSLWRKLPLSHICLFILFRSYWRWPSGLFASSHLRCSGALSPTLCNKGFYENRFYITRYLCKTLEQTWKRRLHSLLIFEWLNSGEIYFYIFFHLYVPINAHFEEETQSIVFSTSFPPVGLAITNSNNSELRRPKKHQRLQPHTRISLCRIHFVIIYPGKGCFFSCVSCASGGSIIDGLGETGNLDSIFSPGSLL